MWRQHELDESKSEAYSASHAQGEPNQAALYIGVRQGMSYIMNLKEHCFGLHKHPKDAGKSNPHLIGDPYSGYHFLKLPDPLSHLKLYQVFAR